MKQSLIIIGAGAAGLMAATELAASFDVTILESADRAGGRIQSIVSGENIIEAGAEFIHGKLPLSFKLLKKAGVDLLPVAGKMYRKENNTMLAEDEIIPGWDLLLKKMKQLKTDMNLQQFLEIYFAGRANDTFRDRIIAYAGGFDLADSHKASVLSLYKEWKAESEDNYRVSAGYKSLITYLEQKAKKKGCNILLGQTAQFIHWEQNDLTVYTEDDDHFYANKILVTVPISKLIQNGGIGFLEFYPAIDVYHRAANNIGFGTVVKIALKFKRPFWKDDTGFIFSDEKFFPTWWTKLPGITPLLTGWTGGPSADMLSGETTETILTEALNSLSVIFDRPVSSLREELVYAEIYNWKKNIHALGAYSYDMVNSAAAKKIMNEPVADTIYFAGEALYTGDHPGTVEAALVSGRDAAKKIKRSM